MRWKSIWSYQAAAIGGDIGGAEQHVLNREVQANRRGLRQLLGATPLRFRECSGRCCDFAGNFRRREP